MPAPILRFVYGIVIGAVLASAQHLSAQATINVPADQATIQDAITVANNGDTVLVAPGTYQENINFQGKLITVTSSNGPSVTIIDGGRMSAVVTFNTGEGPAATLHGFTIQNGQGQFEGGGILIESASPTITGNVIQNNFVCGDGGGIYSGFGSPLIQGNTIQQNSPQCDGNGGGVSIGGASFAQVIGNTIINNTVGSGDGGGIELFAAGSPTISNNLISGNTATGLSPASQGGGIWIVNVSDALITQNLIYNNSSGQGGGIYFGVPSEGRGPILINNTIVGNISSITPGSEVYADGFDSQVQFFNNLMIASPGKTAVFCDGTFQSQPPTFTNNDAFSPNGTGLAGTCAAQAGQNGNISADPQFISLGTADFRLVPGSPAIDAGDNSVLNLPKTDLDGSPRIIDGNNDCVSTVDMGAYESFRVAIARFSSSQLTYSAQVIGTSSFPQSVTLSNTGTTCFQFTNQQITGDFSQTNSCGPAGVLAGASCTYNVVFTPTAGGTRSGALAVTGTDGGATTGLSVALVGTGLTPPMVSLSATSLSFGPQVIGTTSAAQMITVTNTGQAPLNVLSVGVSGPFSESTNCSTGIAGGSSCVIVVAFAPVVSGAASGSITINDNAPGSPQSVALNGTGVDFALSASPSSASVKHGQTVQYLVTVNPVGGPYAPGVALSCATALNAACSLSPTSVVPGANGTTSTLTVSTTARTSRGTFLITVTGQSGALQRSATVSVTVK